ncbi:24074_t:CDS:2 [Dentiscutata erythropus]|uniref:24074_t:CDS:1 n=1 Tax=Dentiscutata erythropus TaxID=1348616 RepID=A0A9N8YTF9_9GLOM|nr:24074_t:CDS:2 [Dentiscutata erythropus]
MNSYIYTGTFSYKDEVSLLNIFIAADEIELFEPRQQVEKRLLETESAWKFPEDFIKIYNDLTKWTQTDFEELEKVLHNCIPHIRFHELSFKEFRLVETQYKNILPNNLLDETYQYWLDPKKQDALPKRISAYPFDSKIINAKDAALIASWIDKKQGMPYRFKNMPFEFEQKAITWCMARGPCFGYRDLWIEHNSSQRSAVGISNQHSYENGIIDKETFEIEEYEVFQIIYKRFSFRIMFNRIFKFILRIFLLSSRFILRTPKFIMSKIYRRDSTIPTYRRDSTIPTYRRDSAIPTGSLSKFRIVVLYSFIFFMLLNSFTIIELISSGSVLAQILATSSFVVAIVTMLISVGPGGLAFSEMPDRYEFRMI